MRKLFLALCAVLAPGVCAGSWNPPGWVVSKPSQETGPTNPVTLPLTWLVHGYRATAGRVDGDRCPSYPTCSTYAVETIRKQGPVVGFFLTAGRLLSESDEAAFSPRIFVGGKPRVYDPVENNLAFFRGWLVP